MKNEKQPVFHLFYSEIPGNTKIDQNEFPADLVIINAYDKPRQPVLSQSEVSLLGQELLREAKKAQRLSLRPNSNL